MIALKTVWMEAITTSAAIVIVLEYVFPVLSLDGEMTAVLLLDIR